MVVVTIYPHMKWGNEVLFKETGVGYDIPSHEMREPSAGTIEIEYRRYTLIWNEGTLSVYAVFSHLKYIVVQPTQKPFTILVTYLICWKNARADYFCGFVVIIAGFLSTLLQAYSLRNFVSPLQAKKIRYRKFCDTSFFSVDFLLFLLIRSPANKSSQCAFFRLPCSRSYEQILYL